MKIRLSYFKNAGLYFSSSIISLLLSLVTFPIYAEWLSAEEFGLIGYYNSLSKFIAPILNLSLTNYFLMQYFNQTSIDNKKTLFNILFFLSVNNIIITIISLIISGEIFNLFNISYPAYPYMIFIFTTAIFSPYKMFLLVLYRINKKALKFFLVSSMIPILNALICVTLVAKLNLGAAGRLGGLMLASIIIGLLSMFLLRKYVIYYISLTNFLSSLKKIWPMILASYAYIPLNTMDKILLERLRNPVELGLYSIGTQISTYLMVAGTAFFQAFEPDIMKNTINHKLNSLKQNIIQFVIPFTLGSVVFYSFLPFIINILTKGKYVDSLIYAKIWVLAIFFVVLTKVPNSILLAKQNVRVISFLSYFGGIGSLILYPTFIKLFGFDGALIAKIIITLLLFIYSCYSSFNSFYK